MAKYTRVSRTSSGSKDASSRSTAQLKDQFIKELTSEANSVLKQLSQQFSQDLQSQAAQLLQGIAGSGGDGASAFGGIAQLLTTGVRYLESQPKTTVASADSARSIDVTAQFRLSQAQSLAEANQLISKGNKNL